MPAAGMKSQQDRRSDGHEPAEISEQVSIPKTPDTDHDKRSPSPEGERPPLPPRPNTLSLLNGETASRATLQAEATTAVSRMDIGTQSSDAGSAHSTMALRGLPRGPRAKTSLSQLASSRGSEAGDSASIRSSILNTENGDDGALFTDFVATAPGGQPQDSTGLLNFPEFAADDIDDDGILSEFESIGELNEEGDNEGMMLLIAPNLVLSCV